MIGQFDEGKKSARPSSLSNARSVRESLHNFGCVGGAIIGRYFERYPVLYHVVVRHRVFIGRNEKARPETHDLWSGCGLLLLPRVSEKVATERRVLGEWLRLGRRLQLASVVAGAEVIAVGPGAREESGKLVPLDVKDGDRILFGKWSGTEVKIDGEDLLIMKESDIMGVLEGVAARRKAA